MPPTFESHFVCPFSPTTGFPLLSLATAILSLLQGVLIPDDQQSAPGKFEDVHSGFRAAARTRRYVGRNHYQITAGRESMLISGIWNGTSGRGSMDMIDRRRLKYPLQPLTTTEAAVMRMHCSRL